MTKPNSAHDFIHVNDVAQAFINAAELNITRQIINVGTGKQTTLKEVAELVIKLTKSLSAINWGNLGRSFDTDFWTADIFKLKELLKIKPLDLESGLKL